MIFKHCCQSGSISKLGLMCYAWMKKKCRKWCIHPSKTKVVYDLYVFQCAAYKYINLLKPKKTCPLSYVLIKSYKQWSLYYEISDKRKI